MVIATIAWPLAVIGLSALLFYSTTSHMQRFGPDWYVSPGLTRPEYTSGGELFVAAIVIGSIVGTAAWFFAMALLGVIWFATKDDT